MRLPGTPAALSVTGQFPDIPDKYPCIMRINEDFLDNVHDTIVDNSDNEDFQYLYSFSVCAIAREDVYDAGVLVIEQTIDSIPQILSHTSVVKTINNHLRAYDFDAVIDFKTVGQVIYMLLAFNKAFKKARLISGAFVIKSKHGNASLGTSMDILTRFYQKHANNDEANRMARDIVKLSMVIFPDYSYRELLTKVSEIIFYEYYNKNG